jgi:hypothetical protein
MQTVIIDILDNKALKLLQDLELLQLIKLHKAKTSSVTTPNEWTTKYKGAMTKQPITEIDNQLNDLRNEWD